MKHILSRSRQGELYVIGEAVLWSFFPVITILAFHSLTPFFTAALSMLVAAVFFAGTLTLQKRWHEVLNRDAIKNILPASAYSMGFYAFLFLGIQRTTAGDTSIILLMEVFFSMCILRVWKKEFLPASHLVGAICMVCGAFVVIYQGRGIANTSGNYLVLLATALPAIGNHFAQQARKQVSSACIMFVRSVLGGCFFLLLGALIEPLPSGDALRHSLLFIMINGLLLMGLSKTFWIEAIHRTSITKAIALGSIAPLFTLITAFFLLHEVPTVWQITGLIPIALGVWLLTSGSTTQKEIEFEP